MGCGFIYRLGDDNLGSTVGCTIPTSHRGAPARLRSGIREHCKILTNKKRSHYAGFGGNYERRTSNQPDQLLFVALRTELRRNDACNDGNHAMHYRLLAMSVG